MCVCVCVCVRETPFLTDLLWKLKVSINDTRQQHVLQGEEKHCRLEGGKHNEPYEQKVSTIFFMHFGTSYTLETVKAVYRAHIIMTHSMTHRQNQ